ncbi:hypothetical protein [Streptomyces alanosinicus]|uniref:Uncharacterized protein n=1 Tax=Streptomyces alanosinicus TaxID=68171 RepID=A0A918YM60_9ACTN|nr:hypothetical protein [Streptomyces alanosinicus]GHE09233.1 hypothetical protein GCM10010339_60820 [Streptomyces alanosinicus]
MTAPDAYSKGDRVTVLGTAGTGADTIGAIAGPDATGTISGPFYRDPSTLPWPGGRSSAFTPKRARRR